MLPLPAHHPSLSRRRDTAAPALDDLNILGIIDLVARQHADRGAKPDRLRAIRAALYAAIAEPSHAHWDRVFQLPVWPPRDGDSDSVAPVSLWLLTVQHAEFPVTEHQLGHRWQNAPSGASIMLALATHFGPREETA